MPRSLSSQMVSKASAALTSAVEVYNKPGFNYREETFALLALNAWELLLKAKILKDNGNKPAAIREYERRRTKAGDWSTKRYVRKNRSGTPSTLSLGECITKLDRTAATRLPAEVKSNLYALMGIRDNAAHFMVASAALVLQTQEIGAASVRNFIVLTQRWFSTDLSSALSLFLPISFLTARSTISSITPSANEEHLLDYLQQLASAPASPNSNFAVAVRVDLRLERSPLGTASRIPIASGPGVINITVTEEDFRRDFPLTYTDLCVQLKERYTDFKQDEKYHRIRRPLESNNKLVNTRYLDPDKPGGTKKRYYSPNIVAEFDKHYTKRV